MTHVRRRTRSARVSAPGTAFEVCAVCVPGSQGPLGGPSLLPVGKALANPDGTITAWVAAQPGSGTLLLRPCPRAVLLRLPNESYQADELTDAPPVGQAME